MMNQTLINIYHELMGGLTINDALRAFDETKFDTHQEGNAFFEQYCVGNTIQVINAPKERFACYEGLLVELQARDDSKYRKMHKGTPFYFLSWLSFDIRDFEKAVFYMDCAISEDKRAVGNDWIHSPMAKMLTLQTGGYPADRITSDIRNHIEPLIEIVYKGNLNGTLSLKDFIDKFVIPLMNDPAETSRSVITALYSYVMEYIDRGMLSKIRGDLDGSIEPWLTHLFKGGLILESLLKIKYPKDDNGDQIRSCEGFKCNSVFKRNYGAISTTANSFADILSAINKTNPINSIETTVKLRNVCGHNLIRDNVFNDYRNYRKFYEQTINAIFYVIEKEYL